MLTTSPVQLFEGNPTLKHFGLWSEGATFTDPLTVATGYAKYTAQFYGLPALFRPIQLQHHRVTGAGNPLELEMSNKYVVKGIKKEQVMNSVVRIFVGADGRIEKVEDRWNGKLPDGAISDVSDNDSVSPGGQVRDSRGGGAPVWITALSALAWSGFCTVSWWPPFLVGVHRSSMRWPVIRVACVLTTSAGFPQAQCGDGPCVRQGSQDRGGGHEDEGGAREELISQAEVWKEWCFIEYAGG